MVRREGGAGLLGDIPAFVREEEEVGAGSLQVSSQLLVESYRNGGGGGGGGVERERMRE